MLTASALLFWLLLQQSNAMTFLSPATYLYPHAGMSVCARQFVVSVSLPYSGLLAGLSLDNRMHLCNLGAPPSSRVSSPPFSRGMPNTALGILHANAAPTKRCTIVSRRATAQGILGIFLAMPLSIAEPDRVKAAASPAPSKAVATMTKTESGLKFLDVVEGSGPEVEEDSRVTFHYIGRLAGRQGKPFEDTYSDEPIRVKLGTDDVIKGLEEGLVGMREGGKRRLLIPSAIGYRNKRQLPIPRSFGNRQRLYSTVLNTERTTREREALGADIAGVVLLDVEIVRVRPAE